jgi:hypothetical protein
MKRLFLLPLLVAFASCEVPANERVLIAVVRPYNPETGKASAPEQWSVRAGEVAVAQPGDTTTLHDINAWGRNHCIIIKIQKMP